MGHRVKPGGDDGRGTAFQIPTTAISREVCGRLARHARA